MTRKKPITETFNNIVKDRPTIEQFFIAKGIDYLQYTDALNQYINSIEHLLKSYMQACEVLK